jgi:hypothetical protein
MKWFCLFSVVVLTSAGAGADEQHAGVTLAPVLKKSEPGDSVVFTLPGASRALGALPAAASGPAPLPATEVRLAPPPADPDRPVLHRPKPDYPPEFELESSAYINQQIGHWEQIDALRLLGDPTRLRPAYSDGQVVNGQILAFPDPTGRYKELELDFEDKTGRLRTLFVYPQNMTWQDCRQTFGVNVRSTQANKGRTFYSYLDRRLDVLVDATGKVISLGMY